MLLFSKATVNRHVAYYRFFFSLSIFKESAIIYLELPHFIELKKNIKILLNFFQFSGLGEIIEE